MNRISQLINKLFIKTGFEKYKDIIWFVTIVLVMHIVWRAWGHYFEFKIFGFNVLQAATNFSLHHLKQECSWILNNLLGTSTSIKGDYLVFSAYSRIGVTWGCSGIKQFYQFIGIILFFYGPWKHKLWFIPMGIVILHLVNVLRITGLSFIVIYKLEWFNPVHDWIVRPFFYVVMFLLWVWWVEKIAKQKTVAE